MEQTHKATGRILLFEPGGNISILAEFQGPPRIRQVLTANMGTPGWESAAGSALGETVSIDVRVIPLPICSHLELVRITGILEPKPQ